jgi:hypothetical protein
MKNMVSNTEPKIRVGIMSGLNIEFSLGDDYLLNGEVLKAGEFELSFSYGALTGTLPEGENINISTECVKTVLFEVMENGTEFLVFCRVECENTESGESVFHTFCINPRVGENGGA